MNLYFTACFGVRLISCSNVGTTYYYHVLRYSGCANMYSSPSGLVYAEAGTAGVVTLGAATAAMAGGGATMAGAAGAAAPLAAPLIFFFPCWGFLVLP